MASYDWRPDLSVGEADIDEDHRELFRLYHLLEGQGRSEAFLSQILGGLEHYARTHFAREEELMAAWVYPDLGAHKKLHRLFIEWLDAVRRSYDRSTEASYEIGATVNEFLGRWLVDHIQHEDMKYRDFIVTKRGTQA